MKPSNIFSTVDNYKRFNSGKGDNSSSAKKLAKKNSSNTISSSGVGPIETGKIQFANREDKTLSLQAILKREFDYQYELRERESNHNHQS